MLKVEEGDLKFDEGVFSSQQDQPDLDGQGDRAGLADLANLPKGMEAGLFATAVYNAPVNNFRTAAISANWKSIAETGKVDITRYNVVDDFGTVLNPLLLHGQVHGGIAQGAGQALMEDIHFDGAASS